MDLYREEILDHYKHPRNFGSLTGADVISEEINISCGDHIFIEVRIKKDAKNKMRIADIRFHGEGCAIHQASASLLTEKVMRMRTTDVMKLTLKDIETLLGVTLTISRVKCAVLPLEALQKAIQMYKK